jgi:transposase
VMVARRSASEMRTKTIVQIRHLCVTGPDELRARTKGLSPKAVAEAAACLRPRLGANVVAFATKVALRALGRRVAALDEELVGLDALLGELVVDYAPALLALPGVGVQTAAALLAAAGDNPERLRSEPAWAHLCGVAPIEASSGRVTRHRLDRGGNRHANQALWHIVMTRMTFDPATKAYVARRSAEGRSKREIIRVLKRYVARQVYPHLPRS